MSELGRDRVAPTAGQAMCACPGSGSFRSTSGSARPETQRHIEWEDDEASTA